jgi:Txe/YoeB family toxin of toxin-antitoxin system
VHKAILSRQALKDLEKLKRSGLGKKAKELVGIVEENPFKAPPRYEKLVGDLQDYYSRRINDQHRFIYEVLPNTENLIDDNGVPYEGIVKVLRMWTHYE